MTGSAVRKPVAVVTGAAGGIGLATCEELAGKGYAVVMVDRDRTRGQTAVQRLAAKGLAVEFRQADVASEPSVDELFQHVAARHDGLDALVNCAGIELSGPLWEFSGDSYDTVMDVNVKGTFLCSRGACRMMMDRKSGAIVNVASVAAFRTWPDDGVYSASKAAVLSLTHAFARELAAYDIRVNAVAPGVIDTDMLRGSKPEGMDMEAFVQSRARLHPLGRVGLPEEVAACIHFLCSPAASFVTGSCLGVDGGLLT